VEATSVSIVDVETDKCACRCGSCAGRRGDW